MRSSGWRERSRIVVAPAGVSASVVNPAPRSASTPPGQGGVIVHGTVSTWPIDTRTQRR